MKWLRDFYTYVKPISPNVLTDQHLMEFLSYLAVERHVAKSTQNQAFNALLFFYRHVLDQDVVRTPFSVFYRIIGEII